MGQQPNITNKRRDRLRTTSAQNCQRKSEEYVSEEHYGTTKRNKRPSPFKRRHDLNSEQRNQSVMTATPVMAEPTE